VISTIDKAAARRRIKTSRSLGATYAAAAATYVKVLRPGGTMSVDKSRPRACRAHGVG
jgi:hypothetical protein